MKDQATTIAQSPPDLPTPTGNRYLLVINVGFSDVKHDPNINLYNKVFGASSSVTDWYKEVSYNKFTFIPAGPGVLTYNMNQPWQYVNSTLHVDGLVRWAIDAADNNIDLSQYDNLPRNGTVSEDELTIIVTNAGDGFTTAYHSGLGEVTTHDSVKLGGEFSYIPEGALAATFCHELGHSLGLPDLYDYGYDGEKSWGVGTYSTMAFGNFPHFTSWEKSQLGWLTPTEITTDGYYWLNDVETHPQAFIIRNPAKSSEYFLIENRWKGTSYDKLDLYDEGILILHVDESQYSMPDANENESHKTVDVECADSPTSHVINADHLDKAMNYGDANDLWDTTTENFNDYSLCKATWYDGTPSGIQISVNNMPQSMMTVYISIYSLRPDLKASYVTCDSFKLYKGSSHVFSSYITNQGNGNAGPFNVRFYLSATPTLGSVYGALGSVQVPSLAKGGSRAVTGTFTVPNSLVPGNYYVLVNVDCDSNITESNENNNIKADNSTVIVANPPKPDLIVTSVQNPPTVAFRDESIQVSSTIRNQGNLDAGYFEVAFLLSATPNLTSYYTLGILPVYGLNASTSKTVTGVFSVPNYVLNGFYYLFSRADWNYDIAESNETNNYNRSNLGVNVVNPPDLIVTSVSNPPAVAYKGSNIQVSSTIKNQGTAPAGSFDVGYVLYNDLTGELDLLGTKLVSSLAAGASISQTASFTIPYNVTTGIYYLVAIADCFENITESSESNQGKFSNLTVNVLPDVIPPTIKSISPTNGATGVARDKIITITFSEPVKWGTKYIEVLKNGVALPSTAFTLSLSSTGKTLTIKPAPLWSVSALYKVILHTGCVKDFANNSLKLSSMNITTTSDAISPTIKSISPINGTTNVLRNKTITVTFSEPVKWGTKYIEIKVNGVTIPTSAYTMSLSSDGKTLTIKPVSGTLWKANTTYTVIFHTGCVTDYAGNNLALASRSFKTGST